MPRLRLLSFPACFLFSSLLFFIPGLQLTAWVSPPQVSLTGNIQRCLTDAPKSSHLEMRTDRHSPHLACGGKRP